MRKTLTSLLFVLLSGISNAAPPNRPQADYGVATLPDSGKYEGYFQDGLFEGEGTITWRDGYKYAGSFKRGLFNGFGRLTRTQHGFEYAVSG